MEQDNDEAKPAQPNCSHSILQGNTRDTEQTDTIQEYRDFASLVSAPNNTPPDSGWTRQRYIGIPASTEMRQLLEAAKAAGISARSEADSESESINMSTKPTKTNQRKQQSSNVVNRSPFAFPTVLHVLLEHAEEESYDVIISWQYHGRAFQVHDPDMFVSKIMPHFFQQTRFSSFLRQLALYDFQRFKQKDHPDFGSYYHELFLRGMPQLCQGMSRARAKGPVKRAPIDEPDFSRMSIVGLKSKRSDKSRQNIRQNIPAFHDTATSPLLHDGSQPHQLLAAQNQVSSGQLVSPRSNNVIQSHNNESNSYQSIDREMTISVPLRNSSVTLEQYSENSQLRNLLSMALNQMQNENESHQAATNLETILQGPTSGAYGVQSLSYPSNNAIALQDMTAHGRLPMSPNQFRATAASFEGLQNVGPPTADEIALMRGVNERMHQTPPFAFNEPTLRSMALLHPYRMDALQHQYANMLNQAALDQFQKDLHINQTISIQQPNPIQQDTAQPSSLWPWHQTTDGSITQEQQQSLLLSHQSFLDEAKQGDMLWNGSPDGENDRNESSPDEEQKSKKQKR
jgi:HSF-type DNA-binding